MKRSTKILARLSVETEHGAFVAHYSDRGLAQLDFPSRGAAPKAPGSKSNSHLTEVNRWHKATAQALKQALNNRPIKDLPPLDLQDGSEFQKNVWAALRKIVNGCTVSYAELASRIGKPKAARAVGSACGANPIPVLIPCHRVLASNGKLGGFSGGLDWKRKLLALEQPADLKF